MKRFLLFAYNMGYQRGGWHDIVGDFNTMEEARAVKDTDEVKDFDWYHIIDTVTHEMEIIQNIWKYHRRGRSHEDS